MVGNRRDLIRGRLERETGETFYIFTGSTIVLFTWLPFILLSTLATIKSGHSWTAGGPVSMVCIRAGFAFAEQTMALKSMERYTRNMYIQSFHRPDHRPEITGNAWSSVQFKVWHLILAMTFAVTLILLGALVPSQKWALWTGFAIPAEITTRLFGEMLWRSTKLGNVVQAWLKKRGWW